MTASSHPWTTGPRELLGHAREHLGGVSDFDKRIALISTDNAVELMVRAYLEQPSRALGFRISRRRVEEAQSSFSSLLDALDEFAADRLSGIDLSDIEWFHRLRNQLYHGGVGLTVERQKAQIYLQLAEKLFDTLFGVPPAERPDEDTLDLFLTALQELQTLGDQLADQEGLKTGYGYQRSYLILSGIFPGYEGIRRFRNDLVHSTAAKTQSELESNLKVVQEMLTEAKSKLEQIAGQEGSQ